MREHIKNPTEKEIISAKEEGYTIVSAVVEGLGMGIIEQREQGKYSNPDALCFDEEKMVATLYYL